MQEVNDEAQLNVVTMLRTTSTQATTIRTQSSVTVSDRESGIRPMSLDEQADCSNYQSIEGRRSAWRKAGYQLFQQGEAEPSARLRSARSYPGDCREPPR